MAILHISYIFAIISSPVSRRSDGSLDRSSKLTLVDLAGSERQTFDPLHPSVVLTPCF